MLHDVAAIYGARRSSSARTVMARFAAAKVPLEERRIRRHHRDASSTTAPHRGRRAVRPAAATPDRMETSRPGVYAAGDLAAKVQGAHFSVAAGAQAAHALHRELLTSG
jgi:hypothetical protein